ncbi:dachshund homolog 2 isoform X3 [Contarinia nasturtii]|uniref:dachshund homolog 2 isoform X3 n=1 Tax=Contarinia nasturtii TaxID=265458 RepID=UPI0012D3CE5E|nr:dachshund homolog 2 isoform X3 [Contarinia nasturtii]
MSMDSAMDSLSTASDHSVASAPPSPQYNSKSAVSPNNNNNSNNNHNMSASNNSNTTSSNHHHNHNRSPSPVSPPLRHHQSSPHMISMAHPLSPPQTSTPNSIAAAMGPRMAQSLPHLAPHSLGLLNSLQMMHHANPLELMAAAHHQMPPRSYNSPPPISTSDPTANECKLVDYRGHKVAAFIIAGDTMLCLPQAFELFLKHLVGGLHTVYTKLKRLDIVPLVCNVEQVRILRGLGAIQPGVNRCKLLSCKDFDILYRDCTTARCLSVKPLESSRPGRPPKRGPVGLLPSSHLSHHPQMKKHRLDNGDYPYENGHMNDISRLEKSPLLANGYNPPPTHLNHMQFMQMNHHPGAMMSPGLPPHGLPRHDSQLMKGQPNLPNMDAIARSGIWENCRAAYEDIVKHLERLREERVDDRNQISEQKSREHTSHNDQGSTGDQSDRSENQSPAPSIHDEDENLSEDNISDVDEREAKDEDLSDNERDNAAQAPSSQVPNSDAHQQAINYTSLAATAAAVVASGVKSNVSEQEQQNLSSTETLLRNIQSLLTVAADNARQQERQISYEKAELKMDVLRERECKDTLERQLSDERKLRVLYQKRFKRERKLRNRFEQKLEVETKRRTQIEDALKASGAPAEALRLLSESSGDRKEKPSSADRRTESPYTNNQSLHEMEMERKTRQQTGDRDVKSPFQERPNYYKNSVLFSSAT